MVKRSYLVSAGYGAADILVQEFAPQFNVMGLNTTDIERIAATAVGVLASEGMLPGRVVSASDGEALALAAIPKLEETVWQRVRGLVRQRTFAGRLVLREKGGVRAQTGIRMVPPPSIF